MTYITLQITDCWEHFMLSPFVISPQQASPDLLFYWLPLCSASVLANTSKDKNWSLRHAFWNGGWKLDLRAPKTSYNYFSGYRGLQAGLMGQRWHAHQKTTVYVLAQTNGCIPFHIFRFFSVCYYKHEL